MDESLPHLLALVITANGAPIALRYLAGHKMAYPVDFHIYFIDQKRLFGNTKTWRGLMASLLLTCPAAVLLDYDLKTGFLIAAGAMSGDLLSSFIKRRLNMRPSSMAPLLDQVPESLIPALLVMHSFHLTAHTIIYLVILFFVLE
ncbi:MAG: CDP-archaeol synthase [Burkholderiales bacterium]|nr:CDP-archaeol synthase [Burkholderiales bacterium]MDR4516381.1 CDP-archaeol synthase [Nitrosomonas sp.]